jgi:Phosphotransferase enzyme family
MDEFSHIAQREVDRLVASMPGLSVNAIQPTYRGGTNRIFMVQLNDQPIVIKYFVSASRWRNELKCLHHLQDTGLTPRLIESRDDRIILMTCLAGDDCLAAVAKLDPSQLRQVSRSIGHKIGRLVSAGLPSEGNLFDIIPWGSNPAASVEKYLVACQKIYQSVPRYQSRFFRASLDDLERSVLHLPKQFDCLFHEDISNAKLHGETFVGFFDLEMCRPGTWQMQLGVALHLCTVSSLRWKDLLLGFSDATGITVGSNDLQVILAMNQFYHWIRICRWGQWDGDLAKRQLAEDSLADADWFELKMQRACEVIGMLHES